MRDAKIQDEAEAIRWFDEGRTYAWMCQEYERQYNIEIPPSVWAAFRCHMGLDRRSDQDDALIPWIVSEVHRPSFALAVLRLESRQRAGYVLNPLDQERLDVWHKGLAAQDLVVDYDPNTDEGFTYVKRRPGVDLDLIREPGEPGE
jgi:hypothetical protein